MVYIYIYATMIISCAAYIFQVCMYPSDMKIEILPLRLRIIYIRMYVSVNTIIHVIFLLNVHTYMMYVYMPVY